jgi:hypothetical protein
MGNVRYSLSWLFYQCVCINFMETFLAIFQRIKVFEILEDSLVFFGHHWIVSFTWLENIMAWYDVKVWTVQSMVPYFLIKHSRIIKVQSLLICDWLYSIQFEFFSIMLALVLLIKSIKGICVVILRVVLRYSIIQIVRRCWKRRGMT